MHVLLWNEHALVVLSGDRLLHFLKENALGRIEFAGGIEAVSLLQPGISLAT